MLTGRGVPPAPFFNLDMNHMNIQSLKALITHIDEQTQQPARDLWRELGADFDRGDIIVMNENLFPELTLVQLPQRIEVSRFLPNDCPGVVMSGEIFRDYRGYISLR